MGEVYRAEDAHLARVVAVKLLSGRFADNDAIRGRFTREGLAVARLSHAPNTVTIFDVGEHEGRPYIVMEYLPGGSLADRLEREGAQPVGRSLDWLGQAAAALDAAHANGIVHRDVKPANLLLDNDERVKVADFGVASAADLGSFTEVGTVVGTAGYLAPEQARGEHAGPASDLYALAVVAFELLTGAPVRARVLDRRGDGARERADPARLGHESGPAARARRRARPRTRQGARAPIRLRAPSSWSAARRARPGRRDDQVAAVPVPPRPTPPHAQAVPLFLPLLGAHSSPASSRRRSSPETTASGPRRRGADGAGDGHAPGHDRRPDSDDRARAATRHDDDATAAEQPAQNPSELNDQGFELMKAGRYEEALPLLEQAVAGLAGTGELAEAYASYNLAFTRRALGQCEGVVDLLDRSEEIQGKRKEISRLRKETEQSC